MVMSKNAFPLAFGLSAAAVLFIVTGSIGYTFSRRVGQYWGHWTSAPVAPELGLGAACALIAVVLWRRAFRSD
jgi:hypothetical protein